VLTLSTSDYLWFVDQALDQMVRIVTDLGDDLANRRPDLPGANSPYVILTHCLGVLEFWGGHTVAGRAIERDRDAEFQAVGSSVELARRSAAARQQFERDLSLLESNAPAHGVLDSSDTELPLARTQGGVLLHIYEELAQHLGQMELTRDVLRASQ
jgi:hypothetical protein